MVNHQFFKVKGVVADTSITLDEVDTTDVDIFPVGGGTGSLKKVVNWEAMPQVMTLSTEGGDQQTGEIQFLEDEQAENYDTYKSGVVQVYTFAHDAKLADARERRDAARKQVALGIDPREQKREIKLQQQKEFDTFEKVARDWHQSNKKWSASHSARVLKSLVDNIFPAIGKVNITVLKTRDLLDPIKVVEDTGRLEVAARLQQRITSVMRYAVQSGLIDYNPAQDMAGAIAIGKRVHRPALDFERIPELLQRIDDYKGRQLTKLAVKLTLLVFIRSSELRFARWSEIDLERAIWTIPAEREEINGVKHSHRGAKMRTPHLVPLSKQAIAVLREIHYLSGNHDLVFIGDHNPHKPMSENTVNKALRVMGYDTKVEVCGHGFRAMACSALVESGKWSRDAVERQMSHQERNSVRAAYIHKAEHLDERRLMMQWWADYLDVNREKRVSPFDFGIKR